MPNNNPNGAPERYSFDEMEEFWRKAHGNISLVSRVSGMSRQGLYDYLGRHPELQEVIEEINEERGDRLEAEIELRARSPETKGSTPALIRMLERKYPERGWGRVDLGGAETDITMCVQHLRRTGIDPREAFASLGRWLAAWAARPVEERALLPWEAYTPAPRTQQMLPQLDAALEMLDDRSTEMVTDAVQVLTPEALAALQAVGIEPAAMLQWAVSNTDKLQRGPPQLDDSEGE